MINSNIYFVLGMKTRFDPKTLENVGRRTRSQVRFSWRAWISSSTTLNHVGYLEAVLKHIGSFYVKRA